MQIGAKLNGVAPIPEWRTSAHIIMLLDSVNASFYAKKSGPGRPLFSRKIQVGKGAEPTM